MIDIVAYLPHLERRAKRLPWQHRTAFAAWCADRMIETFREPLVTRIGADLVMRLSETIGAIWLEIVGASKASRASIGETKQRCLDVVWNRSDDEVMETGCAETIEALVSAIACFDDEATGRAAARAGESLLNKINAQLDFGEELVGNALRHPAMLAEVAKQEAYLELLEHTQSVSLELRNTLR